MKLERKLGLLMAALATTGCGFWMENNPGDITSNFKSALAKVERIERTPAEERGRAHSVHVWAYDADDDQLVTASVPLWLVRRIAKHAMDDEMDLSDTLPEGKIKIKDLLDRGPGLVIQAEEERNRVLIWLE